MKIINEQDSESESAFCFIKGPGEKMIFVGICKVSSKHKYNVYVRDVNQFTIPEIVSFLKYLL